jgi:hypothetical protein
LSGNQVRKPKTHKLTEAKAAQQKALGLEREVSAVQAALTTPGSTEQVEGQITFFSRSSPFS